MPAKARRFSEDPVSDRQTLHAEIVLGDDIAKWLETDAGRYMAAGFEAYEHEALEQLARIWPWRWKRIAQLQERIRIARRFSSLAAEAIIAGRQALQELETPPE